jgi:hypothetical protein
MEKKVVILSIKEPKKHSICYKTKDADAAIQSVYLMRSAIGLAEPKAVKITIEEVS